MIPIFPELRSYLEEVFDAAQPGQQYLITRYREVNATLTRQLLQIIKKAGVEPWPKMFQNLRSTRETELAEEYPLHVVCAWIGNTQAVAAKHYLQVTDDHFEKAAQHVTNQTCTAAHCKTEKEEKSGKYCKSSVSATHGRGHHGLITLDPPQLSLCQNDSGI